MNTCPLQAPCWQETYNCGKREIKHLTRLRVIKHRQIKLFPVIKKWFMKNKIWPQKLNRGDSHIMNGECFTEAVPFKWKPEL